jgi:uncharacterized heparinase superfamily protein
MNRLRKLRHASREEITWRVKQMARIHRDRIATRLRKPHWSRSSVLEVLAPEVVDPVLRTHLSRRDWAAAHRSLVRALRARPRTFVLDPTSALALRQEILARWPSAAAEASERADGVMSGRFDVLGYRGLSYAGADGAIDWHFDPVHRRRAARVFWADVPFLDRSQVGDHKITWEINRHQHFLVLGRALWLTRDRRYGSAIVSQLESWMAANPPRIGINWASSLELGFRSLSWLWALHFLIGDTDTGAAAPSDAPWLLDLLVGLDRHMRHIEENLSHYFSPNTHLIGEALALYAVGVALPELSGSRRWLETGRTILVREIDRQIAPDGGHAERSLHYHRYTLDFYLLALLLAERSQDTDAITQFTDAATRLGAFAVAAADDNGRLPLIGDDDGGMVWPIAGRTCDDVRDSVAIAAVVLGRPDLARWGVPEEAFWIAGRTAIEQEPFVQAHRRDAAPPASVTFSDTGFVVARDGSGGHLVFDVGPHGYMNGGHAHADALSITVGVNGHPFLVDPGTASYIDPALRDRLRATASHNTVTLNGTSSALPAGPFHWRSQANATLHAVRHNPAFDWAEATHDGYSDQRHRRTIFRTPAAGWLVVDEVLGRGTSAADVHWHFDPSWHVTREGATRLCATHPEGGTAWVVHDAEATVHRGDESTGLGWFAPVYGTIVPTWSARVSRVDIAPFYIATCIEFGSSAPELTRIPAECDPGGSAIALSVRQRGVEWVTVLRPGEPEGRETRGCAAGAYHTNGRLLHYGSRDGRLVALAACDATHVLALGEGWISIAADEPMSDLYVELAGETIDLWSSALGARVRLQGALVEAARTVRVNDRPLPDGARERADSVIVLPSQSGEVRRITPCVALPVSQT